MRVLIVGGIFDKPEQYRASHRVTPETVLADGLAARGADVTRAGHGESFDVAPFDVVHVHHLGAGALRAALAPGGAAFVYTHHRPFVGLPTLRTMLLGVDTVRPRLGDVRAGAAVRLVTRCADAVVALSRREAEVHRRLYRVPAERQAVIPNGIPPEPFVSVVRSPADPPELVFVGQLVPFKRVDLLLDAVATLDVPARVRLVYQVDDLRAPLAERVVRLGLADRVTFEGPKPPEDIARLLATATALVLPSAMEALPSVLTEAMLAGVPVVAADVGGVRDQVGRGGVVFQPGSVPARAAALDGVVRERDRWLTRSGDIRDEALRRFSVAAMVAAHVDLYDDVLRRPGRRRRHDTRVGVWRRAAEAFGPVRRPLPM